MAVSLGIDRLDISFKVAVVLECPIVGLRLDGLCRIYTNVNLIKFFLEELVLRKLGAIGFNLSLKIFSLMSLRFVGNRIGRIELYTTH